MKTLSLLDQVRALGAVVARETARREAERARMERALATRRIRAAPLPRDRILLAMSSGDAHLACELTDRTGLSKGAFQQAIKTLINAGRVEIIGRHRPHRYRLS